MWAPVNDVLAGEIVTALHGQCSAGPIPHAKVISESFVFFSMTIPVLRDKITKTAHMKQKSLAD